MDERCGLLLRLLEDEACEAHHGALEGAVSAAEHLHLSQSLEVGRTATVLLAYLRGWLEVDSARGVDSMCQGTAVHREPWIRGRTQSLGGCVSGC